MVAAGDVARTKQLGNFESYITEGAIARVGAHTIGELFCVGSQILHLVPELVQAAVLFGRRTGRRMNLCEMR